MTAAAKFFVPIEVAGPTGATAATRYAGGTASGAPASGSFLNGDFVIDQTGKVWICTVAGSPGTWVQAGGGAGVTYGTPAVVLGTAAAAGATDEAIRRDSTIVAFDATNPTTQAFGDSAAVGSAAFAARRDHKHAMPADPFTGASAGGILDGTYPNPGLAAGVAGAGLSESSDVLAVNVDGSTLEINSDALRVKDGGITTAKLSFDVATQAELDAHISDTSAAHAASAISADSTTLVGTGTDVQAVLEELDNGIADHLADATDAHDASAISVADTGGNYAGTDVEAVLAEIADDVGTGGIGTNLKIMEILVTDPNGAVLTTGDGKAHFFIPQELNGWTISAAHAAISTVSSSGLPTVQIANVTDTVDLLSTKITIDASEKTSYTAATPPVINTSNDDVATGDQWRVDVDVAGTGAKGLVVILTFAAP